MCGAPGGQRSEGGLAWGEAHWWKLLRPLGAKHWPGWLPPRPVLPPATHWPYDLGQVASPLWASISQPYNVVVPCPQPWDHGGGGRSCLKRKLTAQPLRFVRGFLPQKPEASGSLDGHWDWLDGGYSPQNAFLAFIFLGRFLQAEIFHHCRLKFPLYTQELHRKCTFLSVSVSRCIFPALGH